MTPLPGTRRKRNAYRWGRWAESLCAAILRTRGYRILARRWRCPSGEIDIVACRRGIAVFVEVKARDRYETAVESIAPRQRKRIVRAAEAYLSAHPGSGRSGTRFDVMVVAPWRVPRHIVDAWRSDG